MVRHMCVRFGSKTFTVDTLGGTLYGLKSERCWSAISNVLDDRARARLMQIWEALLFLSDVMNFNNFKCWCRNPCNALAWVNRTTKKCWCFPYLRYHAQLHCHMCPSSSLFLPLFRLSTTKSESSFGLSQLESFEFKLGMLGLGFVYFCNGSDDGTILLVLRFHASKSFVISSILFQSCIIITMAFYFFCHRRNEWKVHRDSWRESAFSR